MIHPHYNAERTYIVVEVTEEVDIRLNTPVVPVLV